MMRSRRKLLRRLVKSKGILEEKKPKCDAFATHRRKRALIRAGARPSMSPQWQRPSIAQDCRQNVKIRACLSTCKGKLVYPLMPHHQCFAVAMKFGAHVGEISRPERQTDRQTEVSTLKIYGLV